MLKILDERQYVEFHRRNEDTEEVQDIFFAHPYSLQLLKCFPEILMMDCTYKTNRYGLPLLEICGVTSTGKTFIKRQIEKLGKMASSKRKKTLPLGELTDEKYFNSVLELFDPKIKEHIIERLDNVAPDGHCGYRCCAEFLGLSSDDGWKIVRQRMLLELRVHRELHMGMLGGEKHYSDVETTLDYFGTYGVFKKYWMQFPAMGCLFATAFNCILCVLSPKQYMTYLPLRLGPVDEIKIGWIVLYDDNHFLKLSSKQGAPIPHIVPGWHNHRYPDADIWADVVSGLIDEWDGLIGYPPIGLPSIQNSMNEQIHYID